LNTERLETLPGIQWAAHHPRLAAWLVLSVGMVILLVVEVRDVGLLASQMAALIILTILVAGLCVWIISWEDSEEEDEPAESAE